MTQQFEPFQKVLVRDNDRDNWRCGFFSHIRENKIYRYVTTEGVWAKCIPYEGNENLVGTSDSPTPPEPEFKFGDKVEVSNDKLKWYRAVYRKMSIVPSYPFIAFIEETTEDKWAYCRKADW